MEKDEVQKLIDAAIAKHLSQVPTSQRKKSRLDERFRYWQESSIKQTSFFNNLLLVLGAGVLSLAYKVETYATKTFGITNIEWETTIILFSFITMSLSVLFGVFCGLNRIFDFRYTLKTLRIRKMFLKKHKDKYSDIEAVTPYNGSFRSYLFTMNNDIRTLGLQTEPELADASIETFKTVISTLKGFTERIGVVSRRLLRTQLWLMVIGFLMYLIGLMF